jgi:ribosomal protein L25 (general stress protein Ctc)
MKQLQLSFANRMEKGQHPTSRLRKMGRVPSIIYGASRSFSVGVDDIELRMLMRQKGDAAATIQLSRNEKAVLTILTEVQRNTVTDRFVLKRRNSTFPFLGPWNAN